MIHFKSCPRCQGDVQTTSDMYGAYKDCLQCGYMRDIAESKPRRTRRLITALTDKEVA